MMSATLSRSGSLELTLDEIRRRPARRVSHRRPDHRREAADTARRREMRTPGRFGGAALAFAIIAVLGVGPALAQGMKWRGSGGWGPGGQYMHMYDPKSVETIKGEIVSVEFVTPMKGMSRGVHITLKTEKETIAVHLGPGWFVENQDVKLVPKDIVEVKGARATFAGKPAIIAAEVKKGDVVMSLRDENGFPAWSAMRGR
jgi:hypothetical protein